MRISVSDKAVNLNVQRQFIMDITGGLSMQKKKKKSLTRSSRDSSMLLECSFSFRSSLSTRRLSMSADRCGMLDTQATVRSDAGVGGFSVEGDFEP